MAKAEPWDIEPMHDAKDLFRIVQLRKVDRHYDEYTYEVFIASFVPRKYAPLLAHAAVLLEACERGLTALEWCRQWLGGQDAAAIQEDINALKEALRQARSEF